MASDSTAGTIASIVHLAPERRPFSGTVRSRVRCIGLVLVFALAAMDYVRFAMGALGRPTLLQRAQWLHRWSRSVNRVIGLHLEYQGTPPRQGMIVSNHLSYLDILAYSAIAPCVFVAKQEVASWPILGLFARMAGTIFVDRTHRTKVAEANSRIREAIGNGALVLLFAEGTSSGGAFVLPFRSSLLEPMMKSRLPTMPAAIRYQLDHGSVANEICYWGDMTLVPHLLNVLSKRAVLARVTHGRAGVISYGRSRKVAACELHLAVLALYRDEYSAILH